ncbi:MAG: hypothetical protein ACRCSF_07945 [Mycobacteriaceae bacterium]
MVILIHTEDRPILEIPAGALTAAAGIATLHFALTYLEHVLYRQVCWPLTADISSFGPPTHQGASSYGCTYF